MRNPKINNKVAEIIGLYLPITQTFIYEFLKNLNKFEPEIFTHEIVNRDMFPIDSINLLSQRTVPEKVIDKFSQLFFGNKYFHDRSYLKLFAQKNIRLIHAHFGWYAPSMMSIKTNLNIPLLTTFYGADMSVLPKQPYYKAAYGELFKIGDAFLVEGGHMKSELAKLGCPVDKIRIQHIGIDLDKFEFTTRIIPKNEDINILMCNSFVEKKGVDVGIKAFARSLRHHKKMQLRIIGDGILRGMLTDLIKELKIEDKVKLLGYQDHQFYRRELHQAHIFMAPSYTASDGDSEGGAPTVLLEAQASGIPVLSTFHADIPEVVENESSGFLVPEKNVTVLSESLNELIDSPERWAAMGAAGREHVAENYNIYKEVKHLENIYDSLYQYH